MKRQRINIQSSVLRCISIVSTLGAFGAAIGQTNYSWTMTDSIANWGDHPVTTTDGNYDHSWSVSGNPSELGSSSLYRAAPGGESPIDGRAGVITIQRAIGAYTRTADDDNFDLSQINSSVNTRMVYNFMDTWGDTDGNMHLFEFGLSANSDYFGAPTDDSVFLAAELVPASRRIRRDNMISDFTMTIRLTKHPLMEIGRTVPLRPSLLA